MLRLLKDPLVHFVLLGAAIFGLFAWVGDDARNEQRIVVTEAETGSLWQALSMLSGETPTEADIRQLVEPMIREEVLYREALALGLDRDDSQIRQRLVEKMSFLTDDLLSAEPPSDAELADFLAANRQAFEEPARLSFEQLYFSPSEHGDGMTAAAEAALASMTADDGNAPVGSSSTVARAYESITAEALGSDLGREFAAEVFKLAPDNVWHGPLRSLFGVHLVRVSARSEARQPVLADIRDRVATALNAERRRAANETAYQTLRARYDIAVEIPETVRQQWQSASQPD